MEILRGTIRQLQLTTRIIKDSKHETPDYDMHDASFQLDGRAVSYSSSKNYVLSEGDQVAVAGRLSNGALQGTAIRNFTTGVTYRDVNGFVGCLAGMVVLIAGMMVGLGFGFMRAPWYFGIIPVTTVVGSFILYRTMETQRAIRQIAAMTPLG